MDSMRHNIRLTSEAEIVLNQYAAERSYAKISESISSLILDYERLEKENDALQKMQRSQLNIDKNSQVVIEVLNTLLLALEAKNSLVMETLITTDVLKAPVLEQAQAYVKQSISNRKQHAASRKKRRSKQ